VHTADPSPSADDPLEELLAQALAALDEGGEAAVTAFLAAHPRHADALRAALAEMALLEGLTAAAQPLPQQFGDFRLLQPLGEGGMGVVWLAEQTSLGRQVALKVVRPELLLFEGARERFRREIDAVARLEHPAVVPILASGQADGVPFYAMPALRGLSAEAVVRAVAERDWRSLTGDTLRALLGPGETSDDGAALAGPWWRVVTSLVHRAALGIHHAHERGVLHRDLKPSNLMLTPDGRAIVLDFGLARMRGDSQLTRSGAAAGSPAYMAPEQVRGEPADERTDVYGLAAVLHCLLGRRPPVALADRELLGQRIVAGERQTLRDRTDAPTELRLVLDMAMDVERGRRHDSAAAFAADLQAVLAGQPIAARALPWPLRLRRLAGRHRTLATAMAVAGGFLLLVPLLLWWQQRRANADLAAEMRRTTAANAALAAQSARADRSTEVALEAVDTLLGNVALARLRNQTGLQKVAAELLDDALRAFDRLADDETHGRRVQELRRHTLLESALVLAALGRHDEALSRTDRLLLLLLGSGELSPAGRVQRAQARNTAGWLHYRAGRADAAAALLAAARDDATFVADGAVAVAAARERAASAELASGLAADRGDRTAMLAAARERVAVLEQALGAEAGDRDLLAARVALGGLLRTHDEPAAAEPLLRAASERLGRGDLPETGWPTPRVLLAMARHELAALAHDRKQSEQSLAEGRTALELIDALVRDHPDDTDLRRMRGRTQNLVAVQLHAARRFAEARPLLEQACRDQEFVLARTPRERKAISYLAQHRRSLLVCLRELQDWPALADVARALGRDGKGADNWGRAARDLLRCAGAAADVTARAALQAEALELLVQAAGDGMQIAADDPLYAPLRDEPRFRALLPAAGR
jgi:hypothetical protein